MAIFSASQCWQWAAGQSQGSELIMGGVEPGGGGRGLRAKTASLDCVRERRIFSGLYS